MAEDEGRVAPAVPASARRLRPEVPRGMAWGTCSMLLPDPPIRPGPKTIPRPPSSTSYLRGTIARAGLLPVQPSSSFWRPARREHTSVAQQFVKIWLAAPGPIAEKRQQRRHITDGAVGPQVLNIMPECKAL